MVEAVEVVEVERKGVSVDQDPQQEEMWEVQEVVMDLTNYMV